MADYTVEAHREDGNGLAGTRPFFFLRYICSTIATSNRIHYPRCFTSIIFRLLFVLPF